MQVEISKGFVWDIPTLAWVRGQQALLNTASLTVSGTVTANAGTNLNTSALALESGGNLAAIKADTDKIPSQGQAVSASSMPVVVASDQSPVLVIAL